MLFIETPIFRESWEDLGQDDDDLSALQTVLMINPDAGDLIQHSRGLRKIRVGAKGKGKRGGARVIYYWHKGDGQIFLLLAYPKNERDDLTHQQIAVLRNLVDQ